MDTKDQGIIKSIIEKMYETKKLAGESKSELSSLKDAEKYDYILEQISDVGYYTHEVIMELECLLDK
jgi:hypothetical protein